ncbi:phage tail sheath family protein [Mycetohabitans endofungorum]|uniref:phage tail sheath family protein n=1 Tax=Mycetohabitans endofungorum TaxID=417203 RepID=UPI000962E8B4|nr:Phage tail sheath protein [Burkholderia sp. b13]
MRHEQPGVSFNFQDEARTTTPADTTVPLFAGYTEKDPESQDLASKCPKSPVLLNTFEDFTQVFGGFPSSNPRVPLTQEAAFYYTVRHYFDNGGSACYGVSLGSYANFPEGDDYYARQDIADCITRTDWNDFLEQALDATLLAVPDMVMLSAPQYYQANGSDQLSDQQVPQEDAGLWTSVWKKLLETTESHRQVFVVLDAPDNPKLVRQCLDGLEKSTDEALRARGAVYWPRLQTNYYVDYDDGRQRIRRQIVVPPSGAVVAAIGKTDRDRGIWKAPANVELTQVTRPNYRSWRDVLLSEPPLFDENKISINLIRSFVGRGVRVWGCRTLVAPPLPDRWRYIQVRRTLTYIETTLTNIGRYTMFEPNTAITWTTLKSLARAWLRDLWLAGGLVGAQEGDAFQVLLGLGESMTTEDIRSGRLILIAKLAMQYPAEFIELRVLFQTGSDAVLTESTEKATS